MANEQNATKPLHQLNIRQTDRQGPQLKLHAMFGCIPSRVFGAVLRRMVAVSAMEAGSRHGRYHQTKDLGLAPCLARKTWGLKSQKGGNEQNPLTKHNIEITYWRGQVGLRCSFSTTLPVFSVKWLPPYPQHVPNNSSASLSHPFSSFLRMCVWYVVCVCGCDFAVVKKKI